MAYILSTGVLAKHELNNFAIVEITNYGSTRKFFRVRFIDWTFRRPNRRRSNIDSLRPNRNESAGIGIRKGVARYEIEIIVFDSVARKNELVINCFGSTFRELQLDARLLEGNTVLFKDLILKRRRS
ncbi:hypothetical protein AB6A23_03755 [Paenibacillus tarimensis]